jgi:Heterokaryon incompatibility protein (HET)
MDTTYKTTLSTLEKRKDRIEFRDLPLTYQHAVEVTRNLGLRYLWIDALCIYSHRTVMKYFRILRFAPQFSEGFNFTNLVS